MRLTGSAHGATVAALFKSIPSTGTPASTSARRWKHLRRLVVLLLLLAGGALWLNGPGFRWLAPVIGLHYLKKTGLTGTFRIEGTLTGGVVIRELDLKGDDALARLTIDRIDPVYRLGELRRGQIKQLRIDGVHVDLRLGLEDDDEKTPLDFQKLADTLRGLRQRVMTPGFDVRNVTLSGTRDGAMVFELAPSGISHVAGSDDIILTHGELELADGRKVPSGEVDLRWRAEEIGMVRLELVSGVAIEDLLVSLPPDAAPSADARLVVNEAVFQAATGAGFQNLTLDLREGALTAGELAAVLGVEIPASASLTSFALEADGLLPDPVDATGRVRLLLDDIAWQDVTSRELAFDITLDADSATFAAKGDLLGTETAIAGVTVIDGLDGGFVPGETTGTFDTADIAPLVRHFAALAESTDVPAASAAGTFTLGMLENRLASAKASVEVKPLDSDDLAPLVIDAEWNGEERIAARLRADGLDFSGTCDIGKATYEATLALRDFDSARIARWLETTGLKYGVSLAATADWKGSGEFKEGIHRGKLAIRSAVATVPEEADVHGSGEIEYEWPGKAEMRALRIESGGQVLALDAEMAGGQLELREFLLTDEGADLASGAGTLPVPEDFSKWRETLADDKRVMDLKIESRELPLARFKRWVPALEQIDDRATGRLDVSLSGTFAAPEVDAVLAIRNLRPTARPQLPPAEIQLEIAGRDGKLTVSGAVTAPDFPPATINASMAFLPAIWAEEPGLVLTEPISARLHLPRLDVSRFAGLVPQLSQLRGTLTGRVDVAGLLGKPEPKGELTLTGGGLVLRAGGFPAIEGVEAVIQLDPERITLRPLRATVAGGTFQAEGSFAIADRLADLRMRGDHLPVWRDEMLILRANADLRLLGTWDNSTLSGTVGIVDSVFYRDIEILPIGSPFTTPKAAALPRIDAATVSPVPPLPPPFRDWTLDVTVRTEEPVLIRGNLARGRVDGSVKIGGTFGNPAPDGKIVLTNARASLPFSTLTVREGTATFSPASGFDPVLEFRGNAEPRPYRVDFYVYGRASDPQLVLTSNPPLPENEIMTLLATGTTTRGLEDPQAASSRALQLLAEEMRRGRFPLSRQLRPVLGLLDRVDFSLSEADPYSNDSFSTATLKLHDRWYLSAGMSAEGDTRVLGIWRLRFH